MTFMEQNPNNIVNCWSVGTTTKTRMFFSALLNSYDQQIPAYVQGKVKTLDSSEDFFKKSDGRDSRHNKLRTVSFMFGGDFWQRRLFDTSKSRHHGKEKVGTGKLFIIPTFGWSTWCTLAADLPQQNLVLVMLFPWEQVLVVAAVFSRCRLMAVLSASRSSTVRTWVSPRGTLNRDRFLFLPPTVCSMRTLCHSSFLQATCPLCGQGRLRPSGVAGSAKFWLEQNSEQSEKNELVVVINWVQ